MAKIFDVIARISISTLFLLNGIFKINNYEGTVGWMESFGLPGILIIPAIILEIVGPILIIIGYQTNLISNADKPLLSKICKIYKILHCLANKISKIIFILNS